MPCSSARRKRGSPGGPLAPAKRAASPHRGARGWRHLASRCLEGRREGERAHPLHRHAGSPGEEEGGGGQRPALGAFPPTSPGQGGEEEEEEEEGAEEEGRPGLPAAHLSAGPAGKLARPAPPPPPRPPARSRAEPCRLPSQRPRTGKACPRQGRPGLPHTTPQRSRPRPRLFSSTAAALGPAPAPPAAGVFTIARVTMATHFSKDQEERIKCVKGDLFSCPQTDSLAHCISEDCRMGAGIAVLFKKKFGGVQELLDQRE
ncbi:ADP-ribose glycohydrolase OARD1 isoform X2 [Aquila chrysaetos chrysaetos]|uniref:ADP-ribose glycohydrolase OARD1 isoform X2 n=1 Tax=Aquila chrysaetos chrysaetos TaxID=223781 RepID=UPI001B7D377A|nr:ADP-ribose glycohydrolase OARD1 isoform X2 [Aquila chrysaetos chrysaetos]